MLHIVQQIYTLYFYKGNQLKLLLSSFQLNRINNIEQMYMFIIHQIILLYIYHLRIYVCIPGE